MYRRSWIDIDLNTIRENYRICRSRIDPSMDIMAVVKADAYGHGDTEVSRALRSCGVRHFAVSNLEEAVRVRSAVPDGQILVLGYTPAELAGEIYENRICQAVYSPEYALELCARTDRRIMAHFAVDTGMNRIGFDADDPEKCAEEIRRLSARFDTQGIFTHLCCADTDDGADFTAGQVGKFRKTVGRLADLKIPYVHCMNSAGSLRHAPYGNLARLGIVLYGLKPDMSNVLPDGVKSAMRWQSVVAMVKKVHKGESIGYGCSYTARSEMTVATVPTGYADGYSRRLSNTGRVFVRGHEAPIVGRVCMDQMMIDVTGADGVQLGDRVVLLDENYNADDMAAEIGTIGYEVICDIGKRVPRIYRGCPL
ncbi:MAG: alanine racemase [Clostridia bacterium]|nr:alanine racemase [Clostridia bacterium]